MGAAPALSVVVPMFCTRRFLPELARRLTHACPAGTDVVMVDDACPEQSWRTAVEVSTDLPVRVLRLDRNVGQHAAVLIGLRAATADFVAVLDGDLQDRPEAIPLLLGALLGDERLGAVAAKRSGRYASRGQRLTARCYRAAVTVLSGGRVGYGAGMFLVMRRSTCEQVLALDDPLVPLVPAISRVGMRVATFPVARDAREHGASSHSGPQRIRIAARGLVTLTPLYPLVRRRRARHWYPPAVTEVPGGGAVRSPNGARVVSETDRHNADQIDYFTRRPLPRMEVDPRGDTPYISRQVDAVLEAAGVQAGDRVLDIGCGLGKYTLAIARRGVRVEGLDLTPRLVEALREQAPDVAVHLGDVMHPPRELRAGFDVVTGFFVLHHVGDLPATFAGVRGLLRAGGRAVFCEPNPLFPGFYVQIACTSGMTWKGDGGIVRMRARTLRAAAAVSGLVGFETQRFGALPPALVNRSWGAALERALEAVPGWGWGRAFQVFSMRAAE